VASESDIGKRLIESMADAIAFKKGELQVRVRRVSRTTRTTSDSKVDKPPRYNAERVREVRLSLGYSQELFARALNVSAATVKAWEQGNRVPDGPTLRLLEIAEETPEVLTSRVHFAGGGESIAAD
jgi:DNA-binding transcriptional regulator YiaG